MPAQWKAVEAARIAAQGAPEKARRAKPKASLVERGASRWERMTPAQQMATYGGLLAGGAVTGEVGGRYVGRRRYSQGRHPQDGFLQGPAVNRGYFKAKRKAEGPAMVDKAFASRDQNSSIGTMVTWAGPKGPHRTVSRHARSGHFEGKTRGKGTAQRFEAKDATSSPSVEWIQARRRDGTFASAKVGVEVHRPKYATGSRMPRQSTLMRYTKEGDSAARAYVGKSLEAHMEFGARARVGRRLQDVAKARGGTPMYRSLRHGLSGGAGEQVQSMTRAQMRTGKANVLRTGGSRAPAPASGAELAGQRIGLLRARGLSR